MYLSGIFRNKSVDFSISAYFLNTATPIIFTIITNLFEIYILNFNKIVSDLDIGVITPNSRFLRMQRF